MSLDDGAGGAPPTLAGTDFFTRSLSFVLHDIVDVLRSMAPWAFPLLLLGLWPIINPEGFAGQAAEALHRMQETGRWNTGPTGAQWAFLVSTSILEMVLIAGFAASQHRRVLVQVTPLRRSLSEAVAPYVLYWILAGLAIGVLWVLYTLLAGLFVGTLLPRWTILPVLFVGGCLIGVIALRAILVFPAIAVGDRGMTVERSFRLTQRAIWRMLLAVVLLFLLLVAVFIGFGFLLGPFVQGEPSTAVAVVVIVLRLVIEFVATAVFVTYVSLVYAHLALGATPHPSHV